MGSEAAAVAIVVGLCVMAWCAIVMIVVWYWASDGAGDDALASEAEPDTRYITRINRDGNTYDI